MRTVSIQVDDTGACTMAFNWRSLIIARVNQSKSRRTVADLPSMSAQIEPLEPRTLLTSQMYDGEDDGHHEHDHENDHGDNCGCHACCMHSGDHEHGAFYDEYGDLTWAEGDLGLEDSSTGGGDDGGSGPSEGISGEDDISDVNDGTYDLSKTFQLHSKAGSNFTIYLDFNGHTTSGTYWNSSYNNGNDIVTEAWSQDGDRSTFNTSEQQMIQRIWASVAEDFAPFDVNVTTADPGTAALIKTNGSDTAYGVRVVIGPNSFYSSAGGVAYVGSFDWSSDTPAFVFNSSEVGVREAVSHEVGHTLGLSHDGNSSTSYYAGHGSGATGWAPIMGNSYSKSVTQWSKGEYTGANNTQDDLAIITSQNGFGYRTDDAGDNIGSAVGLSTSGTSILGQGIIERNTDVDFYSFTTGAGNVSIDINTAIYGANLDILATLYDSSGNVVATSNPSGDLDASFNLSLSAGTYYISIDGVGTGNGASGFTDYASLGNYWVSGSVASQGANNDPSANNDSVSTDEDNVVDIDVLGNDTDSDGDTLTITSVNDGSHGTTSIVNGQVRYTPANNYNGTDTFTYTISDGNGGTSTATVTVTIVAVPEQSNITGPNGSTFDTTPTITWSNQTDAARYEILVYRTSSGSLVASSTNVVGTSYTVGTPQTAGDYQVYVRAVNSGGKAGAWDTETFTVAAPSSPTINGPATSTTDTTPTATWGSVTGADHYEVQIVRTSDNNVMFNNTNVSGTSYTGGSSIAAGSYQVRVRAVNDAGDASSWSTRNFSITAPAAPQVTGPATSSTDTTPTATWNTVSGVDHFEVQFVRTSDGSVILSNTNVSGTSLTLNTPQVAGGYQVRVRAVNDTGDAGSWSTRSFTIDALSGPTITGPASNTTDTTPTVTWNSVTGADHYEVHIYNTSSGSLVTSNNNVSGTSFSPGTMAVGSYQAMVRTYNDAGSAGSWSTRNFVIESVISPTITGPASNTTDTTPTVTWNSVTGSDHFEVQIYNTSSGSLVASNNNVSGTSFTPGSAIAAGSFQVAVRTVDGNGEYSNWSMRNFSVDAPAAPTVTGPASNSTDTTPTVTWNTVSGVDHFEVQIVRTSNGNVVLTNNNVSGTSLTVGSAISAGDYQVKVRAVNNTGDAGSWSTRNFTIDTLAGPTITGPSSSTTDTTPTVTWNSVSGADHYEVHLYNTSTGSLVTSNNNVSSTSFTPGSAIAIGSYQVMVRTYNDAGDAGSWSSRNFTVDAVPTPGAPTITGPTGSTNDNTPTISWNSVANADHYEVLIYSKTLGQLVANNNNVSGTSFTVGSSIADDAYRVYVRAVNSVGTPGNWSSRDFVVDTSVKPGNVTITGPSGTTSDTTPTITWNSATNADHYEVLIYSQTLGQLVVSDNSVSGTSFTPGSAIANDSYRVYVRAVSSDGTNGNWSSQDFVVSNTIVPGNVTITGPTGSTNDLTPEITWNAATNAAKYEVLIYNMTLGQLVASANNITGTSYTVSSNLSVDSYRVYVRAISSSNTAGNWSAQNFTTVSSPAGNVTITGPNGSTTDTTPTITWNAANNAAKYHVLVYSTTRGLLMAYDYDVSGTSFTVSSAMSPDSYVVYVRGVNSSGNAGNWSSHNFNIAAAAQLEESAFLDMFWELSSSNEKADEVHGLWTV